MDIQELVEKLQQDGVAKGKQEADKIIAQAQAQAQEILELAHQEEKSILEDAQKKSNDLFESSKNNIKLAARDVMLQLQHQLQAIFQNLLRRSTEKIIADEQILKLMISLLMEAYQKQTNINIFRFEIPTETSQNFRQWLQSKGQIEIKEKKHLQGFYLYDKDGGQIEVSADSVQEALMPFVSQFVRDLLSQK